MPQDNDTNTYTMWHKLSGLYERKNALNKTSLMRKIVRLKYRDGESIVVVKGMNINPVKPCYCIHVDKSVRVK